MFEEEVDALMAIYYKPGECSVVGMSDNIILFCFRRFSLSYKSLITDNLIILYRCIIIEAEVIRNGIYFLYTHTHAQSLL